jgi:HEPN domain-containing protein
MSARTPSDPRQWSEAERWLARADEDLRAAEALLTLAPPAVDPAAFHCQQAAEKMAKAVLIAVREAPPRMHDIEELGRRVRAYVPDIGRALEALGGVTAWYTAARYPDAGLSTALTADDLADTLSRLHELRRHVADLKPKPPVD